MWITRKRPKEKQDTPQLQSSFIQVYKQFPTSTNKDFLITLSHSKGEFKHTLLKKKEEPEKVIKELRALLVDNEDHIVRMKQALENHMKKIKELESSNKRAEEESLKFRNHSLKLEEEITKLKLQVTHLYGYKSEVEILRDKNFILSQEMERIEREYAEQLMKLRREYDMDLIEWEENRGSGRLKSSRKPSHRKDKNSNYS